MFGVEETLELERQQSQTADATRRQHRPPGTDIGQQFRVTLRFQLWPESIETAVRQDILAVPLHPGASASSSRLSTTRQRVKNITLHSSHGQGQCRQPDIV